MASRECPSCGALIKLENLERHAAKVHPGEALSFGLTEKEQRDLRPARGPGSPIATKRVIIAMVLVFVLVAALAWALPNLKGGPDPNSPLHIHPTLRLTIDGQPQTVPINIGIDPGLWRDHTLDDYGMMGSMSPLHTHDTSGLIHVESKVTRDYTIGEFFRVWGTSFDGQQVLGHAAVGSHQVWMTVNGAEVPVSTSLVLADGMQIEIVCGTR